MDRRRAIKFGAIAVAISVVIAIAAYIGVGIAVATMLGNAGFQWKTMERNGFSWAFTDIASPSITATRARLDLGSSSRFTLQRAALDLAAASENQTLGAAFSSVPKWLYVSADPLTVRWRTRTLASGLRSRLAKSSIVATGPTMSIRGTVGPDGVALKLSGELNADALSAKGDAQLRLSVSNGGQAQVEANLSQVKLVVPQASSKPIVFEAVKLTATGDLQQTTGTLTVGDLTGTVALRCTQASPATCSVRINVEGNLGPVLTELSELTRMSRTPKSQGTFAAELEGNLTTKTATLTVHTDAVRVSGTGVDIAKLNGYFEFEGAAPDGSSLMIEGGPDSSGWVDREGTPAHVYAALVASAAGRHSRTTLDLAGFKLSIEGRHETSSIGAAGALVDYIQQDKRADALVLMMERWLFAAEVADRLGEEQTMEIYANAAHWGPGIYGIRAAADYYFGASVADLTPRQGAFLGSLVPFDKVRHDAWYEQGNTDHEALAAILSTVRQMGAINEENFLSALDERLRFEK